MKGYVRASHLVYLIIISVIILSFFLVIAFGGLDNASTMLGTASTVSSLILSAIAILMSLVDVAGQRQQIVDLKETAEQLALSNESSHKFIENLITKIDEISLLKDSLLEQIKTNEEWKEEIKTFIGNTEEKKPEDYKKILEDLVKKSEEESFTKTRKDLFPSHDLKNDGLFNVFRMNKIEGYLRRNIPAGGGSLIVIRDSIAEEFHLTIAATNKILKNFEERGFIELRENTIRLK